MRSYLSAHHTFIPRSRLTPESISVHPRTRSRSVGTIAGGFTAGALGLTGAAGLLFYPVVSLSTSSALALKTGPRPGDFFDRPLRALFLAGALDRSALLSYLLFWTLAYALRGA